MPETQLHLELRTVLYQLLKDFLGPTATVASNQFVYWIADDPTESLAPDACVRRGEPTGLIRSWKTWERGAPEVAVEIVSDSDAPDGAWREKLARYRRVGVTELVRFDAAASTPDRLRLWDRVEGDLVERVVEVEQAPSSVLPLTWVVGPADGLPVALRIRAGDADATLVPTREEARFAEAEARRVEGAALRVAEARIVELEAELAKRR